MKIDKKKLIQAFVAHLEEELLATKAAAQATYEAATHEENKPENEYDTRGLEASYLAGAQAKRAAEIDEVLSLFKTIDVRSFGESDPISATAFVRFELDGKLSHVLVMPKGGGFSLNYEGQNIQVITPQSKLGGALLGLRADDTLDLEINGTLREYTILNVI